MRKVVAIALLLMLCCGALAEAAPGNALGFSLLARMDGGKNRVISPISLGYALSMAAAGAEGETLTELLAALGVQDATEIAALTEPLNEAGLRCANAAFVMPGVQLLEAYAQTLRDVFGAESFELDGVDEVNAWVRQQTDGMIDPLLESMPVDVRLMLVNAVAMDAKWTRPFEREMTREDVFHAPEGDVQAEFMNQEASLDYGERDGVQFVKKRYESEGLAMWVALPPEDGLDAALAALAEEGLDWFTFEEERCRVCLSLPKLDLSVSSDLTDALREAGLERALSEEAQFGGISEEPLKISDVLQKVRLQVDEDGTRAAAATAMIMANGMVVDEPIRMTVDRPFVLLIVEETTGAALFAAAVVNPVAK